MIWILLKVKCMEELSSNILFIKNFLSIFSPSRNAKSIELDERNDNFGMHLSRLGNYCAKQIPSKAIHDSFKAEQERFGGARQFRAEVLSKVFLPLEF